MLQRSVWSQLARVNTSWNLSGIRTIMDVNFQPPIKVTLNQVDSTFKYMSPNTKHWFIGGERCLGVGIKLLQEKNIIAVPTDTIYGLATLAQDITCVENLYKLKGRLETKPVAICLSSILDIPRWAETDHLPKFLLGALLPGKVTVVLKRKPKLNPALNPGIDSIGIRVPETKFIRRLCRVLNQPLALTSANSSNEPSSLTTTEFKHLWPELAGIFYTIPNGKLLDESNRIGSTVVDLTNPYEFKIIRAGIGADRVIRLCLRHGMKNVDSLKSEASDSIKIID